MGESENQPLDLEWENRKLCSDGNCIGTIGPDGRCRECGKPYSGEVLESGAPEFQPVQPDKAAAAGQPTAADATAGTDDDAELEWDSRRLCSDGNCIGVIGPDGRCKECGKPFDG